MAFPFLETPKHDPSLIEALQHALSTAEKRAERAEAEREKLMERVLKLLDLNDRLLARVGEPPPPPVDEAEDKPEEKPKLTIRGIRDFANHKAAERAGMRLR